MKNNFKNEFEYVAALTEDYKLLWGDFMRKHSLAKNLLDFAHQQLKDEMQEKESKIAVLQEKKDSADSDALKAIISAQIIDLQNKEIKCSDVTQEQIENAIIEMNNDLDSIRKLPIRDAFSDALNAIDNMKKETIADTGKDMTLAPRWVDSIKEELGKLC